MRKGSALALSVALLLLVWFLCSKIAQSRREATYRVAISQIQHDLAVGKSKAEVEDYLRSRKVSYRPVGLGHGGTGDTYLVQIGEDPGSFVCEPGKVYVAIEFDAADKLRQVHIQKI